MTLLPVELTWEAMNGYENIEDNKKVTAVDANDNPTTREWMQGKGSKIFPDRKNPTDQSVNRNRCVLHIKGALPNSTVYLKTFDVDDATSPSVDNDTANKIDTNGRAGDDNKDTVWPKSGQFVSSGTNTKTVTTDGNGEAKVIFETTMQPGDNFRVALALKHDDLNTLQVSNENGDGFVDGDSEKQPKGFSGVVSPMLTVWRRLWCEFDSMGPPATTMVSGQITQMNHDEGVVLNVQDNGNGTSTITVRANTNADKSEDLTDYGPNRYESGKLYIDGVGTYTIISNNQNQIIIGENPGNGAIHATFQVYDDDYEQIGSRSPRSLPYQISGGKLIFTAFADAYIEPIKVPSQYIQTNVPFRRNMDVVSTVYGGWAEIVSANRNLAKSADFWTVYCLSAWQGERCYDADPDNENPQDCGLTDPTAFPENESCLYVETIRENELVTGSPRTAEQHTLVHEIGHQAGGAHTDKGIMETGAPIANNQFKPITINKFRNKVIYSK